MKVSRGPGKGGGERMLNKWNKREWKGKKVGMGREKNGRGKVEINRAVGVVKVDGEREGWR